DFRRAERDAAPAAPVPAAAVKSTQHQDDARATDGQAGKQEPDGFEPRVERTIATMQRRRLEARRLRERTNAAEKAGCGFEAKFRDAADVGVAVIGDLRQFGRLDVERRAGEHATTDRRAAAAGRNKLRKRGLGGGRDHGEFPVLSRTPRNGPEERTVSEMDGHPSAAPTRRVWAGRLG